MSNVQDSLKINENTAAVLDRCLNCIKDHQEGRLGNNENYDFDAEKATPTSLSSDVIFIYSL